ncbi:hypothetical protein [Kitasatospora sp. NPDC054795]
MMAADRELRIRTVHSPDDTRTVLTYKGARVDEASGSKPEAETGVENADAMHEIVRGLPEAREAPCPTQGWGTALDLHALGQPKKASRICWAADPAGRVPART